MKPKHDFVQGSLFEEDYLIRTLGALVHSPDVALTELVANAWDAGASLVSITIPEKHDELLVIEDDGLGLTKEEFHSRWMRLGYNRMKHQGNKVTFPKGRTGSRLAYGRNGVGRHGLLCFNNEYHVKTKASGHKSEFVITTLSEDQPFILKNESFESEAGHGTRLEVFVKRNLPNADRILDVISARFLHDPQFIVKINGRSVPLEDHSGLIDSRQVKVDNISLNLNFIDSQKAAQSTLYQGVAFWQARRLVGEPSWILGDESVIDGRTHYAKRYTIIVKSDDLAEFVLEDWTGFKKDPVMNMIYKQVAEYSDEMFRNVAKEHITETKETIKRDFSGSIGKMTPLGHYEVDEAIEYIAINYPTVRPEIISMAVETVIKLENTRSGKELLQKLSQLSDDDIAGLNQILDQWTIKDALCVLDEIDRRISIIEAIKKLSSDKEIDELKILHPLVTEARWLFGPEFDSPEYVSNKQLRTAVKTLFGVEPGIEVFENHRKRPDLLVLQDSSISVTGTDSIDSNTNLTTINKILLIELKRGGFEITRKEREQAVRYIEDLMDCGSVIGNPYINAFVVGDKYTDRQFVQAVSVNGVEMGKARVTTFGQLVDTAEKRLFGLREKLDERYDEIPGLDLYRKTIQPELKIGK